MSALLNELAAWGCDIDSALPRFSHKEDFYARCFKRFVVEPSLDDLGQALNNKDADTAFHHAQTLKNLTANLGLTPLYDIVVRIVDPLRLGKYDDHMQEDYRQLIREVKRYKILADRDGA